MSRTKLIHAVLSCAAILVMGALAQAQQCNDFNECTNNDMCSDGFCMGTPAGGGSCNDFNECTVNDHCVSLGPEGSFCMGDPAPVGTGCQGGCGICQAPIPVPGVPLICMPRSGSVGTECTFPGAEELGRCFVGRCREFGGGGFSVASCIPEPTTCPDTDGNPCTDACNPANGRCERIEIGCGFPDCTRCDASTGSCVDINEGRSCDDFNECTAQSRCELGNCVPGVPSGGATPTSTVVTASTPTATRTVQQETPTVPAAPSCAVDCNNDGVVLINEVITAVGIGLGTNSLDLCLAADVNRDGSVAVNEVILGVNNGQNGCPA